MPKQCGITGAIFLSIGLGALNSILSKIKADQLQRYDGLVSGVMNALGYVVGYTPILYWRYRLGIVTREMLRFMYVDAGVGGSIIKGAHKFIVIGGLADEAGQVASSIAQPYVSIVATSLLSQTSSLWTMVTSYAVLGARYTAQEFAGIAIALGGASIEVVAIRNGSDNGTQFSMALLVLASAVAPAFSFVFKEKCFRLWNATRKDRLLRQQEHIELDVWVVASAAAMWSLIWAPATSLFISLLKKPSHVSVAAYAMQSFRCFANKVDYSKFIDDDDDSDAKLACRWAWQFWLLYMANNVAYNISIYRVVRLTSALTSFICGKLVTPTAILLSLLPWPVIGSANLEPLQLVSLCVILAGVAIFRHGSHRNNALFGSQNPEACCWPLLALPGSRTTSSAGFQRVERGLNDDEVKGIT